MELLKQIDVDIKAAMLAKDADKLRALRGLKKSLQDKETEKRGQERNPDAVLTSADEVNVIQKALKTRRDSADIYNAGNRPDLAKIEVDEIALIEAYLPKQLTTDEVTIIVQNAIATAGATSIKDMGKVMSIANVEIDGRSDGKTISNIVKQLLTATA